MFYAHPAAPPITALAPAQLQIYATCIDSQSCRHAIQDSGKGWAVGFPGRKITQQVNQSFQLNYGDTAQVKRRLAGAKPAASRPEEQAGLATLPEQGRPGATAY